jgi:regulatory protein
MPDPEEVKRGIGVATGFIAYRIRSEFEVRRRLGRAGVSDEDVDATMVRLREMMLIDDAAFAGAFARDQMIGMKHGPIRVRNGLVKLGVDKEIAAAAIGEVLADHDTFETAMALGEKRWSNLQSVRDSETRRKRVYEFLVRRGYPFDESRSVVDELEKSIDRS